MTDQRHSVTTYIKSLSLLLIGIVAIGFVVWNIIKEQQRTHKIDELIAEHNQLSDEIQSENTLREKTIAYLESDESSERRAMELGYQKEGWNVAVVKDVTRAEEIVKQQKQNQTLENVPEEEKSNWKLWWEVFFKI